MLDFAEAKADYGSFFQPPLDQRLHYPIDFKMESPISGMLEDGIPSFSSSFCSSENEGVRMPNSSASIELERMNSHSSGFFLYSHVSNDLHFGSFTPLSAIEISQAIDQLPETDGLMTNFMCHNSSVARNNDGVCRQSDHPHINAMGTEKRRMTMDVPVGEEPRKTSKKRKQPSEETSSTPSLLKAPVRRSQKIADRVTALQQLVSPFGKTNTASVLHEATIHIKLLQEQIQELSKPYFRFRPHLHPQSAEDNKFNLRSRGLCLVPISSTLNLKKSGNGNSSPGF